MDTTTPDSQALPPGTHLHEFVIEHVLGSGGFGITYLARDTSLGRQVVIKENLPTQFVWRETATGTVRPRHTSSGDTDDFEWSMKNFLREAETLATLDHPGIVRVLRKFEANGTAYFVMPFVQGVAFDQLITERQQKNQQFSEAELRGLLERMLDALGYLHDRGIYHRDIKPANLLITMEGIPTLIDFGSARQRLSERSMTVIESAGYTPFEQLQSRGNVGPWSDLYALGATLCKALTGDAAPKANDRAFDDPFMPLADRQELAGRYSPEFLMSIDKALASRVADRWQNSGEWLGSLGVRSNRMKVSSVKAPVLPHATESRMPVADGQRLSRKKIVWVSGLIVALLGFFGLYLSNRHTADREKMARQSAESYQQQERIHKTRLLELAESGDAYAQALVGFDLLYVPMEGISDDERAKRESESLKWLEKSSAQGHPLGLAIRGSAEVRLNQTGGEVYAKKRYEEAVRAGLLEDLEQQGAVWSCFAAVAYDKGRGIEKNPIIAVKWYRKAADQGIALSQFYLGMHYSSGEGVAKDEAEAVKWYRKVAEAGDAYGMNILGNCYENGSGMTKDEVEAVKWYRKAAEAGNGFGMCDLGFCYETGTGVAKDEVEAVKWYRKAAEEGYARGMSNLGVCYDTGTGVAKDEAEAVKWCRKAADAGEAVAMNNLGVYYMYGNGITKDETEAVKWYRKAADAGDARGMNNLGECYETGKGVTKDDVEAVKWYRKALDAGDEQVAKLAAETLQRLGK